VRRRKVTGEEGVKVESAVGVYFVCVCFVYCFLSCSISIHAGMSVPGFVSCYFGLRSGAWLVVRGSLVRMG